VDKTDTLFIHQHEFVLMLVPAGWCWIWYESIDSYWRQWWRHCWWVVTSGFLCSDCCLCSKASKVYCLLIQILHDVL